MQSSIQHLAPTDLPWDAASAWSATAGQPSDLEHVFTQYLEPIHRFLHSRVGNREDAEDLTSEVFVKATRLLDGERSEASMVAWLFTVARTVLADHWRKYYRSGDTVELDELRLVSTPPEVERSGPSEANAQLLERTMNGLSERHRQVLELRFLLGYTVQETATEMGISPGNVKVMQHRALAQAVSITEKQTPARTLKVAPPDIERRFGNPTGRELQPLDCRPDHP
jgi:RNA polymerase sigma-70 factor (ECF subfamily)